MKPGDEVQRLSHSRLKSARACSRLHHYEYELGYRPTEDASPLRFGKLFDVGLEAWWLAAQAGAPQEDWLAAALQTFAGEADPFDRARAQVLLTGYHLRWKDEPFEVLAVQPQFEAQLVNPATGRASRTWVLAGKLDAVVRDLRDGAVCVLESKTSGEDISPGSEYWKRLRLDGQVSVYFDGARALGFEAVRCVYDVAAKPKLRPLQVNSKRAEPETPDEFRERVATAVAEEPGKYFARGEVVRLEQELEDARFDAWQLAERIREDRNAGRHPRNPDSCSRYGRTCPFFGVCTGEASLEDARLFRRLEDVHPELERPAASH